VSRNLRWGNLQYEGEKWVKILSRGERPVHPPHKGNKEADRLRKESSVLLLNIRGNLSLHPLPVDRR
jgi:hypothetical protein